MDSAAVSERQGKGRVVNRPAKEYDRTLVAINEAGS